MKSRQIGMLFSPAMVLAIKAGRKSRTRRVVKWVGPGDPPPVGMKWTDHDVFGGVTRVTLGDGLRRWVAEPPWWATDVLLVKEAHRLEAVRTGRRLVSVRCVYEADGYTQAFSLADLPAEVVKKLRKYKRWGKLRSGRFLFSCMVRFRLTVERVGVERVKAISEEEAVREGMTWFSKDGKLRKWWMCDPFDGPIKCTWQDLPRTAREAFLRLFFSINERAGEGEDPWVWVVGWKTGVDGE